MEYEVAGLKVSSHVVSCLSNERMRCFSGGGVLGRGLVQAFARAAPDFFYDREAGEQSLRGGASQLFWIGYEESGNFLV